MKIDFRKVPHATVVMTALALFVYLIPPLTSALEYRRLAIAGGQIWRFVTCHWTHVSFDHLLWDSLTFLCLGIACERRSRPRFMAAVGLTVVLVPPALWFLLPSLRAYRGLSGLDCALFALLAVSVFREESESRTFWRTIVLIFFSLFLVKVGIEAFSGTTLFVDNAGSGMVPVPLAHIAGGAAGLLAGLVNIPATRIAKKEK